MSVNDKNVDAIDIKAVLKSLIIGIALFIVVCFVCSILIRNKIIPFELKDIYSKAAILISVLLACSYAAQKGRGEAFINSLSCAVVLFAAGILCSFTFTGKQWDTGSTVICLLICCLCCFLAILKKKRNSKMHKRRRKTNR